MDVNEVDITSMPRYVEEGYPWASWDLLRQQEPVYWYAGRAGPNTWICDRW